MLKFKLNFFERNEIDKKAAYKMLVKFISVWPNNETSLTLNLLLSVILASKNCFDCVKAFVIIIIISFVIFIVCFVIGML
jgi:hypothetical protein